MATCRDDYCDADRPADWIKEVNYRWMAKLPDDKKLSELTIPGTHETCALYGALNISKCQSWSLRDQLDAGIRFIDIRCRHYGNEFPIHHGSDYQYMHFGEVRDICQEFLKANPTECIIMNIRHEYDDAENTRSFEDTLAAYLDGHERYWYVGSDIPILRDVRGKIVLIRQEFDPGRNFQGISLLSNEKLDLQRDWEVPTILPDDISKHWRKKKDHLDQALMGDQKTWFITFTNGSSGTIPNTVADRVNPHLFQYLTGKTGQRLGTILMDFPGEALIERIRKINDDAIGGAPIEVGISKAGIYDWFGSYNQGGGIAAADITGDGHTDLVVFHIDVPGGGNKGYYRIGRHLRADGTVQAWTKPVEVPGWFGSYNQGGDIAVADITGDGYTDLVVFHIDVPGGGNKGYYRIGRHIRADGTVQAWTDPIEVPGWFGNNNQGAGIAVADITGGGHADLVVFHIDVPGGGNKGYYRIGRHLRADGTVQAWTDPIEVPGWFGNNNQGAGIAVADVNGDGHTDLVVFHIDAPDGENAGYYRIGWHLQADGTVQEWTPPAKIPGWFGSNNQGAGIAVADTTGGGHADLVVFHIDVPGGGNKGYYRIYPMSPKPVYLHTISARDRAENPTQVYFYSTTRTSPPHFAHASTSPFSAYDQQVPGTVPVYEYRRRMQDRNQTQVYQYSTDSTPPPGFSPAGIAFYAYKTRPPIPATVPVFQYVIQAWDSPQNTEVYFYATDPTPPEGFTGNSQAAFWVPKTEQ